MLGGISEVDAGCGFDRAKTCEGESSRETRWQEDKSVRASGISLQGFRWE